MKRLFSIVMAAALSIAMTAPAMASHDDDYDLGNWWYTTSAIDTDLDGQFDLSICFGAVGQNLYTYRSQIMEHIRGGFIGVSSDETDFNGTNYLNGFGSNGACSSSDNANVHIVMSSLNGGSCIDAAVTTDMDLEYPSGGNSQYKVRMNTNCLFDWDASNGIASGYLGAKGIILHEVIHAWGLEHSGNDAALMSFGGPDHCSPFGNTMYASADDNAGIQARYSGITDTNAYYSPEAPCIG